MTRTLLAIESSTDWLSVALLRGEDVVVLREHEDSRQHASALLPTIDAVLGQSGLGLDDLEAIGVATGPGSFTSLRIGLATVKGLGFERELTGRLPEGLYAPPQLAEDLDGAAIMMTPEPPGWRGKFEEASVRLGEVVEGRAARPRADWVGRLAQRRLTAGEGGSIAALGARYLRRAEAEAKRLGGPVEEGEVARLDDAGH